MDNANKLNIIIAGTSWWVDTMYLPALKSLPNAAVIAVLGRNEDRARSLCDKWKIPNYYTNKNQFFNENETADILIVATSNASHYEIAMMGLDLGLHVLCEKPLALTYRETCKMLLLAESNNLTTMTPFTYRYMPYNRYVRQLLDEKFLGSPYHINMRYYASFGRNTEYSWRFNQSLAGSGALGDIGSHFLYLAYWFFGEFKAISCRLQQHIQRAPTTPSGEPYTAADDAALIQIEFASGAVGTIHVSTVAYENTPFKQIHQYELHGSDGTIHVNCDWDKKQSVKLAKSGEGATQEVQIPDHIWEGVRRDTVHNTYRDVFRDKNHMTRQFINSIWEGQSVEPSFKEGALIQKYIEACIQSHEDQTWVEC